MQHDTHQPIATAEGVDAEWQQLDAQERSHAEQRIQKLVVANLWKVLLGLAVLMVLPVGTYLALQDFRGGLSHEQVESVFAWLNLWISATSLCVAFASAVITYVVARLAYQLAAQARHISEETLLISKLAYQISERESMRESAQHAATVRAALNQLGSHAEQYLDAMDAASLAMRRCHWPWAPLLQWHLQCLQQGEVYGHAAALPYAQKQALLLQVVEAQLVALEGDATAQQPWQALQSALLADTLTERLSLSTVVQAMGMATSWHQARQQLSHALRTSLLLWRGMQSDATLLALCKADTSLEAAYGRLYEAHRRLLVLVEGDEDAALEVLLRAQALTHLYVCSFWCGDADFNEVQAGVIWLAVLCQGGVQGQSFYAREHIGVDQVLHDLRSFLATLHTPQARVAEIFHLQLRPSTMPEGSAFVLSYPVVDDVLHLWQRMQPSIEQVHEALQPGADAAKHLNDMQQVEHGLERWQGIARGTV